MFALFFRQQSRASWNHFAIKLCHKCDGKGFARTTGTAKMSKSWFKDSSVEWDWLQLLQWSDASSQARHTAGENSPYFTWHDQKIGFLWKPEVFPAIFVALFPAKCIVSFQPLAPPKTRKPIWARKLAQPKTRFCIQFNQFTPTLKDALVTILCSEWIRFIMVGSHLYRAMSFHDTEHLAKLHSTRVHSINELVNYSRCKIGLLIFH